LFIKFAPRLVYLWQNLVIATVCSLPNFWIKDSVEFRRTLFLYALCSIMLVVKRNDNVQFCKHSLCQNLTETLVIAGFCIIVS
jgi:hypothetical protein